MQYNTKYEAAREKQYTTFTISCTAYIYSKNLPTIVPHIFPPVSAQPAFPLTRKNVSSIRVYV
jgi:hypothetical protein